MVENEKKEKSRRDLFKAAGALAIGAVTTNLLSPKEAEAAQAKAPRWAMVIDIRRCVGCFSCQVSCKMENAFPMDIFGAWVLALDKGQYPDAQRVFLPKLCNNCEGNKEDKIPPCVKACPEYPKERQEFITPEGKKIRYRDGATYKRPDGLILINNEACTGCGKCIEACPYGVRSFDKRIVAGKDKTKHGVTKCNFCQPRIDAGLEPSCVRNCVGKARVFGDLNDPNSEVSKLIKENTTKVLKPEEKTSPCVYYIELDDDIAKIEDNTNPKPKITETQG
jgi:tetrathionate reductase subunit B